MEYGLLTDIACLQYVHFVSYRLFACGHICEVDENVATPAEA